MAYSAPGLKPERNECASLEGFNWEREYPGGISVCCGSSPAAEPALSASPCPGTELRGPAVLLGCQHLALCSSPAIQSISQHFPASLGRSCVPRGG